MYDIYVGTYYIYVLNCIQFTFFKMLLTNTLSIAKQKGCTIDKLLTRQQLLVSHV